MGHIRMEGREVFKHAVGMITDVVNNVFAATGYGVADLDWFVPHQANKRIIDGAGMKLGIPPEKVVRDRRQARQYLGRLGPAGAQHRGRRRPDQARRPRDARSDGRRIHLGRLTNSLVSLVATGGLKGVKL